MIHRRGFLLGLLALLASPLAGRGAEGDARGQEPEGGDEEKPTGAALAPATRELLDKSGFVYISPLQSDGGESTCHGEVWYGWLDGAVVITTRRTTWKARAVQRGLDEARIWVGDHGRWKRALGLARSEAFRKAPSFRARARVADDPELLDRLLSRYDAKYPDEMKEWHPRMREGHASGERVLIRYEPVAGG